MKTEMLSNIAILIVIAGFRYVLLPARYKMMQIFYSLGRNFILYVLYLNDSYAINTNYIYQTYLLVAVLSVTEVHLQEHNIFILENVLC